MLSNVEMQALKVILECAIVKSQEDDDGDPVFHEVNINDVNPFHHKKVQSDVYDRLAEKGFIDSSIYEDQNGTEEYVCITRKGLEALKLSSEAP